jgi:5-methyltetrahydrofolate--homocysteine methyltransferase
VEQLKEENPKRIIMVGGAPLTQDYCNEIGADFYSPDPQGAIEYLNSLKS